jgi:hypothetical protein
VIAFDSVGTLADRECGWPLRGFMLGDGHSGDGGARRADPEPIDESIDPRQVAAGQYLDPAVGEVVGVPDDSKLAGPYLRAASVENALYSASYPADSAYQMGVLLAAPRQDSSICWIFAVSQFKGPWSTSTGCTLEFSYSVRAFARMRCVILSMSEQFHRDGPCVHEVRQPG